MSRFLSFDRNENSNENYALHAVKELLVLWDGSSFRVFKCNECSSIAEGLAD